MKGTVSELEKRRKLARTTDDLSKIVELAEDKDSVTRFYAIYSHPTEIPTDILQKLRDDPDQAVKDAVRDILIDRHLYY